MLIAAILKLDFSRRGPSGAFWCVKILEMKNGALRFVFGSTLISILLITSLPIVSASTVNIDLNPTSGVAKVTGISTTNIVFTYPANSTLSSLLNGSSYTKEASGNVAGGQSPALDFQDALRNYTSDVTVQNLSVSLSTVENANTTAMVITRQTNITGYVSGVFNVTNGTVSANLGWKAFAIRGPFVVPLDGHDYDLNTLGSATLMPFGESGMASSFLSGSFGDKNIWSRSTIDFSSLNTPLTNWTKVYDASTNTTTFTKTINTLANYSSSVSFNGQNYSLTMKYDPSSTIKVSGYASPSGNSLMIGPAPASQSYIYPAIAVVVVGIIALLAYMAARKRGGSMAKSSNSAVPTN